MSKVSKITRTKVVERARYRCEYCLVSSRIIGLPLTVDHWTPTSLGGSDNLDNLCAACYRCNEYKGAKTHALDSATKQFVSLFNPRMQQWADHFAWANGGMHIIGLTPTGRATVVTLRLNSEIAVEARALWVAQGWHPPAD